MAVGRWKMKKMGSEVDFPEFYRRDAENAEGFWVPAKARSREEGLFYRRGAEDAERILFVS